MNSGWYARKVFPWILDWSMAQSTFIPLRETLLAKASGCILEIGLGTGANIPYYSSDIRVITTVDPNPGMIPFARSHMKGGSLRVDWTIGSAERLPFASATFDTIVSTMTLCSIPMLSQALKELLRVGKPGGQFLFLEHGQSPDGSVRSWQDHLTPLWKHLGDGCHLNRPISQLLQDHAWKIDSLDTFYLPKVPKPLAYFYHGVARKTAEGM